MITARAETEKNAPVKLRRHHGYRRTLSEFMATLKATDFDHNISEPITTTANSEPASSGCSAIFLGHIGSTYF